MATRLSRKDGYTISFPSELFTTETMQKLERILDSKGALIKSKRSKIDTCN